MRWLIFIWAGFLFLSLFWAGTYMIRPLMVFDLPVEIGTTDVSELTFENETLISVDKQVIELPRGDPGDLRVGVKNTEETSCFALEVVCLNGQRNPCSILGDQVVVGGLEKGYKGAVSRSTPWFAGASMTEIEANSTGGFWQTVIVPNADKDIYRLKTRVYRYEGDCLIGRLIPRPYAETDLIINIT